MGVLRRQEDAGLRYDFGLRHVLLVPNLRPMADAMACGLLPMPLLEYDSRAVIMYQRLRSMNGGHYDTITYLF